VFERYTEEARQVVVLAQEEARAVKHNYVGTEHLLLGLLRLPRDSVVGQVLAALELTPDGVRARLLTLVPEGEHPSPAQMPFTPRAKKTLEMSLHAALARGDNDIGAEHILLGLADGDDDGVAVRLLRDHDVTRDEVRDMVVASLPPQARGATSRSILRRARRSAVQHLPIQIDLSDEARRLLMSAGARALDDGRTLITVADIEQALRRHHNADDPPAQSATG